jgi:serine/threonine protein kinase
VVRQQLSLSTYSTACSAACVTAGLHSVAKDLTAIICTHLCSPAQSDMWSLGCVLYEMATLRQAFEAPNMRALVSSSSNPYCFQTLAVGCSAPVIRCMMGPDTVNMSSSNSSMIPVLDKQALPN